MTAVLAQWALIRLLGDVWWLGTMALFAPRWPLLVPIAMISCVCAFYRRKLLWLNFTSALVLLGPVMGFCIASPGAPLNGDTSKLRIMSLNAGWSKLELLSSVIAKTNSDVVTIQEAGSQLPEDLFDDTWHVSRARGLTIASRYPILDSDVFNGSAAGRWIDLGLRTRIEAPMGEVWVCCVYMESPREGFESLMLTRQGLFGAEEMRKSTERRDLQSKLLRDWVAEVDGPLVIAGDFNQPPESRLFRRDWSAFQDTFAQSGVGYGYTWFSSWHGVRIDHILIDEHWRVINSYVSHATGGDHRPIVAELKLGLP